MGYTRHHAIVVTSWHDWSIDKAATVAAGLGMTLSPTVASPMNGYRSFLVCPDGSKEGWLDSASGDEARDAFVQWLETGDGNNPPWCDWVEVQYGDEAWDQRILRASKWPKP